MSDPKDKGIDLEGVDWDNALAEWEEKSFVPEVAKDRETQSPGSLQGTPAPPPVSSRPLYVPPPESKPGSTARPPPITSRGNPSVPPVVSSTRPPPRPAFRSPAPTAPGPIEEEEGGETLVAAIPRELLRRGSDRPVPRSTGGGLGQMFARVGTERTSSDPAVEDDLENAPTATRVPEPAPPDEAVFTSAQELELRNSSAPSNAPRRPRGPVPDPLAALPEGEMFDPFAEPDPFQSPASAESAPPAQPPGDDDDVFTSESAGDASAGPPLLRPARRAFDPDTDTSSHMRGALHAPARREYDPNEDTGVLSKAEFRAHLAEPPDDEGEDPTRFGARGDTTARPRTQSWENERSAQELLPDAMRTAFAARAEWIEVEGRAAEDRTARARALLVASELRAILGDTEGAEILAREAAATAPQLAMAPRQARALAPVPREAASLAEALDAEGRQSPTHAGRVHDALLAADVLRLAGDGDGAAKRWDQAIRVAPSDPRAPLARAAERLARRDLSHPALRLPDAPELAPLGEAFARALKIRGVAHPDVATEEKLPNDALRRAREAIATGELGAAAESIAELARVPELRDASSWLAASLAAVAPAARAESVDWLRIVAARSGPARRALAARALELDAGEVVEEASKMGDGFSPADRAVLAFLAGVPHASSDEDLDALEETPDLKPLGAALAAVGAPKGRAERAAGAPRTRDTIRLARLIAADAPAERIESALAAFEGDHDGETRAVALEMASRAQRFGDVSDAIASWSNDDNEGARDRSLAAALVAERAGDRERATGAYASARDSILPTKPRSARSSRSIRAGMPGAISAPSARRGEKAREPRWPGSRPLRAPARIKKRRSRMSSSKPLIAPPRRSRSRRSSPRGPRDVPATSTPCFTGSASGGPRRPRLPTRSKPRSTTSWRRSSSLTATPRSRPSGSRRLIAPVRATSRSGSCTRGWPSSRRTIAHHGASSARPPRPRRRRRHASSSRPRASASAQGTPPRRSATRRRRTPPWETASPDWRWSAPRPNPAPPHDWPTRSSAWRERPRTRGRGGRPTSGSPTSTPSGATTTRARCSGTGRSSRRSRITCRAFATSSTRSSAMGGSTSSSP